MADFAVQRGQAVLSSGSASVTLTAGTDYTAPASADAAFFRITNVLRTANGIVGEFVIGNEDWGFTVSGDITTSITLTRYNTTTLDDAHIEWEIIEYVGSAGGTNEFIVRHTEELTLTQNVQVTDTGTVSGVSDASDVVVFITGGRANLGGGGSGSDYLFTSEYVSGSSVGRVSRQVGDNTAVEAAASVAVVEFTGSNWAVQRATHTYSAAGAVETETITAVGDVAKTFTHPQLRTDSPNLDEVGQEVWLSATDTLSFQLESGADVDHEAVVWVVENTQSGGTTDMSVQRISGSEGDLSGAPYTWTETITAVAALATVSIMGETSRSDGTGGANERNAVGMRLTATDTVTLETPEGGKTQTYRFEVVEWPEEGAGGQTVSVGQATETSTALGVGSAKSMAAGQSGEADSALAMVAEKSVTPGQATETEAAQAVGAAKAASVGQASVAEQAFALSALKAAAVGLSSEADTALAVSVGAGTPVGLASEADSALSPSVAKALAVGLAAETDSAPQATPEKAYAIVQATETDAAFVLTVDRAFGISVATAAESAFALSVAKAMSVGLATEIDTALAVTLIGVEVDIRPPFLASFVDPARTAKWVDPTRWGYWVDPDRTGEFYDGA